MDSAPARALVCAFALGMHLAACSNDGLEVDASEIAMAIDGVGVDCARPGVFAGREVTGIALDLDGLQRVSLRARFGGEDISRAFELDGEIAQAWIRPSPEQRTVLEITARTTSGQLRACRATVYYAPAVQRVLGRVRAESTVPVIVSPSADSGAPGVLLASVPLAGISTNERVQDFVRRYAGLFGVARSNLERVWEAPLEGGRTRILLRQSVDDVRTLDGTLMLEIDETGMLRRADSTLIPDDRVAVFRRAADEVRAGLGAELRVVSIAPVLADVHALSGIGEPGLSAAWIVEGVGEALLVTDDSLETVARFSRERAGARVEIHEVDFEGSNTISGHRAYLAGDSAAAAPTRVGTPMRGEPPNAERIWRVVASAANYYERQLGRTGWPATTFDPAYGPAQPIANGTVRVGFDVFGTGRFLLNTGFLQVNPQYGEEPDLVCHEYAHSMDYAFGNLYATDTLVEAAADLASMHCEAAIAPGRDPFRFMDLSLLSGQPARDMRAGVAQGVPGRLDFEDYVPSRFEDPYATSLLLTHSVHRAVENPPSGAARMRLRSVERVSMDALAWTVRTFPDFRERWIATLHDQARSGSSSVSHADVCAMARGFQATNLDGDYAASRSAQRPLLTTTTVFACTATSCPLCECLTDGSCASLRTRPPPDPRASAGMTDPTGCDPPFPDTLLTGACVEITGLKNQGIVSGSYFRPNDPITRAEWALMLVTAFRLPPSSVPLPPDVPRAHYASDAIARVLGAGFMVGYAGGSFRPSQFMTRQEVLVSLASGLTLPSGDFASLSAAFPDAGAVPAWARNQVADAFAAGCLSNDDVLSNECRCRPPTLQPTLRATRTFGAVALWNALRYPVRSGSTDEPIVARPDVVSFPPLPGAILTARRIRPLDNDQIQSPLLSMGVRVLTVSDPSVTRVDDETVAFDVDACRSRFSFQYAAGIDTITSDAARSTVTVLSGCSACVGAGMAWCPDAAARDRALCRCFEIGEPCPPEPGAPASTLPVLASVECAASSCDALLEQAACTAAAGCSWCAASMSCIAAGSSCAAPPEWL